MCPVNCDHLQTHMLKRNKQIRNIYLRNIFPKIEVFYVSETLRLVNVNCVFYPHCKQFPAPGELVHPHPLHTIPKPPVS